MSFGVDTTKYRKALVQLHMSVCLNIMSDSSILTVFYSDGAMFCFAREGNILPNLKFCEGLKEFSRKLLPIDRPPVLSEIQKRMTNMGITPGVNDAWQSFNLLVHTLEKSAGWQISVI